MKEPTPDRSWGSESRPSLAETSALASAGGAASDHSHHGGGEQGSETDGRWHGQVHGYVFLNANRQDGPSGGREFEAQNHIMAHVSRGWLGGKLSLLGMFTLEPATIAPEGGPQLFQRGETYSGRLLVDRQHPHELFAALAAQWEKDLAPSRGPGRLALRLYAAPVGEPALGPTAYVHRLSASENPSVPLAHHNLDSTHISADVLTAGLTVSMFTIEASAFHGREPDAHRWDIDQGRLDSYSGRLWVRPAEGLAIQVSAGRREHPEELESGNQTRQTASVEYERRVPDGFLAATLAFGRNRLPGGRVEDGGTLEATWNFARKNFVYGRIESVDRDLVELVLKGQRPDSIPPDDTSVQAATIGYVRDLPLLSDIEMGLGADATFYRYSSRLDAVYGDNPVSAHFFLRMRFERPQHKAEASHMH